MRTDNDYEKEISHMVGIINDLEALNAELLAACKSAIALLENTAVNQWDLDAMNSIRSVLANAEVSDE